MSNWDEHASEIEVLQSIFIHDGEFVLKSDSNPMEFDINLIPYPEHDCENHVSLTLNVKYTEDYPNVEPDWKLENLQNFETDMEETLKKKIKECFAENCGIICIYQVTDVILEYLRENNRPVKTEYDKMLERRGEATGPAKPVYEESDSDSDFGEEPEFQGLELKKLCPPEERLTTEEFEQWSLDFKAEMEEKGIWRKIMTYEVPTGRQMFEREKSFVHMDAETVLAHLAAAPKAEAVVSKDEEAEQYLAENEALFHVDEDEEIDFDELDDLEDD